jgi:uncharacterized membrane protein YhdT
MGYRDLKAFKTSMITLTLSSVFLIVIRIAGYRLFDESFELFCIHVPSLVSIILYTLLRYFRLKLEA